MRVLLVEDEPEIASIVAAEVGRAGFTVDTVDCYLDAEAALGVGRYALVLLDRRLPDGEGLGLLREARARQPGTPVIILSALDRSPEVVRGLDAGADDYLTKPLDLAELLARIRAALRKTGTLRQPPITCGKLMFDADSREVLVRDQPLILKRRELSVLESLIRRKGRVVLRETLIEEVYGFDDDIQSNTLDAHVSRLRGRLSDADAGVAIHPVRGVGYMLDRA
ncbi:response regulator transcription factor [uncultured Sphingomonas sp.]|uniref:response regulator transcription factor n=1 Tax=uncultured Sphingomonas sp. TaxID=158754 RepID=UPI0035CBAF7C